MVFERKVLAYIESIRDDIINTLRNFIRIPTVNPPGEEDKLVPTVSELLRKMGLDVEVKEVFPNRHNVIGYLERGEGPRIILNGHMDVVPPGENWTVDPFSATIKNGKLYGRGASDMKSGLVAMIMAVKSIIETEADVKGSIVITAVVDEEVHAAGTRKLVEEGISGDMAIVGEPTNLGICIAHKGGAGIYITTKGRIAHASVPEEGVNAILGMAKVINALDKYYNKNLKRKSHRLLGHPTLAVTLIRGGLKHNIIPDKCEIYVDRRTIPGERTQDVIKEIQEIIDEVKKRYAEIDAQISAIPVGPESEDEMKELEKQKIKVPPHKPMEVSPESEIVTILKEAIQQITGKEPQIKGMPGWTDAALLTNMSKIPTVVFGPGDILQAHSNEEWVAIEELIQATKVYIYTALRVCG